MRQPARLVGRRWLLTQTAADLSDVDAPRRLEAIDDADEVFGLRIVGTPGHTAGHIAVFDADPGVLVADDALNNDGELTGSNPSSPRTRPRQRPPSASSPKLRPTTILVGHGDPIVDGAAAALEQLASSLA